MVGERKQTDFRLDNARHMIDESFEIIIRNHKDSEINVIVKENLYRGVNWRIFDENARFEKIDAHTVHFPVSVKADGEKRIRYTVRYTWD